LGGLRMGRLVYAPGRPFRLCRRPPVVVAVKLVA